MHKFKEFSAVRVEKSRVANSAYLKSTIKSRILWSETSHCASRNARQFVGDKCVFGFPWKMIFRFGGEEVTEWALGARMQGYA